MRAAEAARLVDRPGARPRGRRPHDDPAGRRDPRRWFALADLARRLEGLAELSMGMSDDYEVAIEEGATIVRVGRRLFGPGPDTSRPDRGAEGGRGTRPRFAQG